LKELQKLLTLEDEEGAAKGVEEKKEDEEEGEREAEVRSSQVARGTLFAFQKMSGECICEPRKPSDFRFSSRVYAPVENGKSDMSARWRIFPYFNFDPL
jgi:hypothetical protein